MARPRPRPRPWPWPWPWARAWACCSDGHGDPGTPPPFDLHGFRIDDHIVFTLGSFAPLWCIHKYCVKVGPPFHLWPHNISNFTTFFKISTNFPFCICAVPALPSARQVAPLHLPLPLPRLIFPRACTTVPSIYLYR